MKPRETFELEIATPVGKAVTVHLSRSQAKSLLDSGAAEVVSEEIEGRASLVTLALVNEKGTP